MRTDRLTKLADLLDTVPEAKFNMEYWGRADARNAPDRLDIRECGTSACALGWACSIPEFVADGLRLEKTGSGIYSMGYTPYFTMQSMTVPMGKVTYNSYDAGARFFDITLDEAEWLFSPDQYIPDDTDPDDDEWDASAIKPAVVADRIRALIRGEGPTEEDDDAH